MRNRIIRCAGLAGTLIAALAIGALAAASPAAAATVYPGGCVAQGTNFNLTQAACIGTDSSGDPFGWSQVDIDSAFNKSHVLSVGGCSYNITLVRSDNSSWTDQNVDCTAAIKNAPANTWVTLPVGIAVALPPSEGWSLHTCITIRTGNTYTNCPLGQHPSTPNWYYG